MGLFFAILAVIGYIALYKGWDRLHSIYLLVFFILSLAYLFPSISYLYLSSEIDEITESQKSKISVELTKASSPIHRSTLDIYVKRNFQVFGITGIVSCAFFLAITALFYSRSRKTEE